MMLGPTVCCPVGYNNGKKQIKITWFSALLITLKLFDAEVIPAINSPDAACSLPQ